MIAHRNAAVYLLASTNKTVLSRLCGQHPLPAVLLQWRRLHFALTAVLCPLLRAVDPASGRLRGRFIRTATGRMGMHQPNLQTVPKAIDNDDGHPPLQLRRLFVAPSSAFAGGWCDLTWLSMALRVLYVCRRLSADWHVAAQ